MLHTFSGGQGVVALEDVTGGFYQPSIDDVGGSVLCQCCDASDAAASTFAEYGPVVMGMSFRDRYWSSRGWTMC